jgi:hypothetical protein
LGPAGASRSRRRSVRAGTSGRSRCTASRSGADSGRTGRSSIAGVVSMSSSPAAAASALALANSSTCAVWKSRSSPAIRVRSVRDHVAGFRQVDHMHAVTVQNAPFCLTTPVWPSSSLFQIEICGTGRRA